jgi:hypothetical protein
MAHFAKISEDNIVLWVSTLNDKDMLDENGNPNELIGQKYLEKHNNWPAHLWIQTSYNTKENKHLKGGIPFRGNYAGIGYIWDPINNIFLPCKKPYSSWILNLEKARWESPIGNPPGEEVDFFKYSWNEDTQSWDQTIV